MEFAQGPVKLPLSVDDDGMMTDAEGRVVANFCYRTDLAHVRAQVEKARWLADLANLAAELQTDPLDANEHEPELAGAVAKPKGNPAFQKGKPNPYK